MKIKFSLRALLIFLAVGFTTIPVLLFGIYEAQTGVQRANQQASETNREAALASVCFRIAAHPRFAR